MLFCLRVWRLFSRRRRYLSALRRAASSSAGGRSDPDLQHGVAGVLAVISSACSLPSVVALVWATVPGLNTAMGPALLPVLLVPPAAGVAVELIVLSGVCWRLAVVSGREHAITHTQAPASHILLVGLKSAADLFRHVSPLRGWTWYFGLQSALVYVLVTRPGQGPGDQAMTAIIALAWVPIAVLILLCLAAFPAWMRLHASFIVASWAHEDQSNAEDRIARGAAGHLSPSAAAAAASTSVRPPVVRRQTELKLRAQRREAAFIASYWMAGVVACVIGWMLVLEITTATQPLRSFTDLTTAYEQMLEVDALQKTRFSSQSTRIIGLWMGIQLAGMASLVMLARSLQESWDADDELAASGWNTASQRKALDDAAQAARFGVRVPLTLERVSDGVYRRTAEDLAARTLGLQIVCNPLHHITQVAKAIERQHLRDEADHIAAVDHAIQRAKSKATPRRDDDSGGSAPAALSASTNKTNSGPLSSAPGTSLSNVIDGDAIAADNAKIPLRHDNPLWRGRAATAIAAVAPPPTTTTTTSSFRSRFGFGAVNSSATVTSTTPRVAHAAMQSASAAVSVASGCADSPAHPPVVGLAAGSSSSSRRDGANSSQRSARIAPLPVAASAAILLPASRVPNESQGEINVDCADADDEEGGKLAADNSVMHRVPGLCVTTGTTTSSSNNAASASPSAAVLSSPSWSLPRYHHTTTTTSSQPTTMANIITASPRRDGGHLILSGRAATSWMADHVATPVAGLLHSVRQAVAAAALSSSSSFAVGMAGPGRAGDRDSAFGIALSGGSGAGVTSGGGSSSGAGTGLHPSPNAAARTSDFNGRSSVIGGGKRSGSSSNIIDTSVPGVIGRVSTVTPAAMRGGDRDIESAHDDGDGVARAVSRSGHPAPAVAAATSSMVLCGGCGVASPTAGSNIVVVSNVLHNNQQLSHKPVPHPPLPPHPPLGPYHPHRAVITARTSRTWANIAHGPIVPPQPIASTAATSTGSMASGPIGGPMVTDPSSSVITTTGIPLLPAATPLSSSSSSSQSKRALCFICFEAPADAVFMECGHAGACMGCADIIVRGRLEAAGSQQPPWSARDGQPQYPTRQGGTCSCPICRAPVLQILRIGPDVQTWDGRTVALVLPRQYWPPSKASTHTSTVTSRGWGGTGGAASRQLHSDATPLGNARVLGDGAGGAAEASLDPSPSEDDETEDDEDGAGRDEDMSLTRVLQRATEGIVTTATPFESDARRHASSVFGVSVSTPLHDHVTTGRDSSFSVPPPPQPPPSFSNGGGGGGTTPQHQQLAQQRSASGAPGSKRHAISRHSHHHGSHRHSTTTSRSSRTLTGSSAAGTAARGDGSDAAAAGQLPPFQLSVLGHMGSQTALAAAFNAAGASPVTTPQQGSIVFEFGSRASRPSSPASTPSASGQHRLSPALPASLIAEHDLAMAILASEGLLR